MMLGTIYLCALLTCGLIVSVNTIKPGLELVNPPRGNENECLESELTFRCTTTGKGTTVLNFEKISAPESEFRHSRYTSDSPNQNDNKDYFDGEIRVGNLSLSNSEQCFNSRHNSSDCYTTSLVVRISNRTMCGIIVCRTIFTSETGQEESKEFGRDCIVGCVPPPASLNVSALSLEEVTVTWEAETSVNNCSGITYDSVTSSNCGSCSPPVMTRDGFMYVTCMDPVAGQICNVSVRSMLECGIYSNPRILEVKVPELEGNPMDVNNSAAIGIGIGVTLFIVVVLVVGVIAVLSVYFVRRKSRNSRDFEPVPTGTPSNVQEAESSLNGTKVVAKDNVEKVSVEKEPLLNSSLNSTKEPDDKQTSGTNAVVAPIQKQTSSIVAMESEGVVDSQNGGGLHTGVAYEDTGAAAFRDMPIAMLPPSVQTFGSPTESGKQSTSSIVSQGDSVKSDNKHEMAPKQNNMTEGGRPVSQDSELTPKDSKGEVPPKKPVIQSGNEDGPAQAVAIKGAQNFTNVNVAESCPVADILKRHEERLTNLEASQLDSKTKIDTLNTQIASLLEQLETMRTNYAALEKKSEEERQRHHEEEEKLKKVIKQLREELAAEKERAEKLEKENKTMPRKALSTETNPLNIRPPYQRTKSYPQ